MEYVHIFTCMCTYVHAIANVCQDSGLKWSVFLNQCLFYMLNWDIWLNLTLPFPRIWLPSLLQGLGGSVPPARIAVGMSPPALECALGSELPSSCWCGTSPVHVLFQCRIPAQAGYSLRVWLWVEGCWSSGDLSSWKVHSVIAAEGRGIASKALVKFANVLWDGDFHN